MTRVYIQLKYLILTLLLLLISQASVAAKVTELSIHGGIGPATADYVVRGITSGQQSDLILIRIDTPGGLDKSMRQMVQSILNSDVAVVAYVAPSGARAASAGTFLLYASTIAAMAPGTHLGAASPVSLTGGLGDKDKKGKNKSTMNKKVTNDAVAYIRTLAQLRGRDVAFAEKAVLDAATLTAPEALKEKVINFIAQDAKELFTKLNGLSVKQNGRQITLDTTNAQIETIQPDWRMRLLQVITDPTIAYVLLLLGIYGIFFELMNPGVVAPGVIGAVAIIVALYALQLLPINYAGLTLLLLGIAFIISETFTPSFGILGIGGTIAFVVGSIFLFDTQHAAYQISWPVIAIMAAINVLIFVSVMSMLFKSKRKQLLHGTNVLIGAQGRTIGFIDLEGQAVINGEIWQVYAKQPIKADAGIKVIAVKGLRLEVEPINGE